MLSYQVIKTIQQTLLYAFLSLQSGYGSFVYGIGTNQLVDLYRVLLALTV